MFLLGGVIQTKAMPSDDPVDVLPYAAIAMADLSRYIDEYGQAQVTIPVGEFKLKYATVKNTVGSIKNWRINTL